MQVIVFTDWMGRTPDLVEDQVTYPIVTDAARRAARQGRARQLDVRDVVRLRHLRGRHRHLLGAQPRARVPERHRAASCPTGVTPDARPGRHRRRLGLTSTPSSTRPASTASTSCASLQDWNLRYALGSVPGVAEVASVGGFVQAVPDRPRSRTGCGPTASRSTARGRRGPQLATTTWAAGSWRFSGREYYRARPRLPQGRRPISRRSSLGRRPDGTPDPREGRGARAASARDIRRGRGRSRRRGRGGRRRRRHALRRERLRRHRRASSRSSTSSNPRSPTASRSSPPTTAPSSSSIRIAHAAAHADRGDRSSSALVILCSCSTSAARWCRSSRFPIAVLLAFIPMVAACGLTSNIMSLGGIAIAIGAMVDAAIIMVENAHKRIEARAGQGRRGAARSEVIIAGGQGGGAVALLFAADHHRQLPAGLHAAEDQEGRLFKPLAYTKTFSMAFAALLSVTLVARPDDAADPRPHPPRGAQPAVARARSGLYGPSWPLGAPLRWPILVAAALAGPPRCSPSCAAWAASSCRRSTKGRCSTCRPRCPA